MATAPRSTGTDGGNGLGADVVMVGESGDGLDLDERPDTEENEDWDAPGGKKPVETRATVVEKADGGEAEDAYGDERLAFDPDEGDGQASEREISRRARRNRARREQLATRDREIAELRQSQAQTNAVLARLTQGQVGLAVSTIDQQISSLQQAMGLADQEMASAITSGDTAKLIEVQRLRDDIVMRLNNARQHRHRFEQQAQYAAQAPQQQAPPQHQAPQTDPRLDAAVEARFNKFLDRHPWFDPEDSSADANIVRAIDAELVTEGFPRHTSAFWNKLEQRMADYGLARKNGDDGDDDQPSERRVPPVRERRSGPPTGSGRSVPNRRAPPRLSEYQVSLLREEGLDGNRLSETDQKRRDRLLAAWKAGEKVLNNGSAR